MKSYIVLRNNNESGPYTLTELKSFGLSSTDLIWIEGESTSWSYAAETEGLEAIAKSGSKIPFPLVEKQTAAGSFIPDNNQPFTEYKEPFYFPERSFVSDNTRIRKNISIGTSVFGFTVLIIGLGLCAFVVKRMVDGFDTDFSATANAKMIKAEVLAVNTTSHAAKAEATLAPQGLAPLPNRPDTTQVKPQVLKPTVQHAAVKEEADVPEVNVAQNIASLETATEAEKQEEPVEKAKEEKKEVERPKLPSLQVSANDYKVGMLGGISNLELAVSNPSTLVVDKAIVEVEYLKPNGNVVKSQTLTVENITPGGSKKIVVPSSNRGVKVRYKIIDVQVEATRTTNDI